jgi:hypothetical protein
MSKMGLHDAFGHFKHKLWQKEGPGVKLPNLTPDHLKSGITPISLRTGGM